MECKESKVNVNPRSSRSTEQKTENKKWEKPTLEDVSKKVMAQPYIRFT